MTFISKESIQDIYKMRVTKSVSLIICFLPLIAFAHTPTIIRVKRAKM